MEGRNRTCGLIEYVGIASVLLAAATVESSPKFAALVFGIGCGPYILTFFGALVYLAVDYVRRNRGNT